MLAWQIPYLGWRKVPVDLSEFEIEHFFTLKPEEGVLMGFDQM